MRVLIVGTGYVGLVTGVCLAEIGHQVICLDIDIDKIARLKQGAIPIYEPGLEEMVQRNSALGRLSFTTDYALALPQADICFIAVSTPSQEDGSANLAYVRAAAQAIASHMREYKLIVHKSTVPIGTAKEVEILVREILDERKLAIAFDVVSNPEFLKEGDAIQDFMHPDRIILGGDNQEALERLKELYAPLGLDAKQVICMDSLSAELTKYAANALLASRISFMNELAGLCEIFNADISQINRGVGSDRRIGPAFLQAGCGYGGSCFPKDIKALKKMAEQKNYDTPLLQAIEEVNERQKKWLGEKIAHFFSDKGGLLGKKIALWGLAFKPGTDDMREAPSLPLIRFLLSQGAQVHLYDPCAMRKAKELFPPSPQLHFGRDAKEVCQRADAIVLVTEWKEFLQIDLEKILPLMKGGAFFDGRNQFDPKKMQEMGFDYFSIGRPRMIQGHAHKK